MTTWSAGIAWMELVMLLAGGSVFGLPPGDRDMELLRTAPANALVYMEWSERGTGEPGAAGIDGLAADPEIQTFLADLERTIRTTIDTNSATGGPEIQLAAQHVPQLIQTLLNRPGCVHLSYNSASAANAPKELGPMAALMGVQMCVVLNGGEQADEITGHADALFTLFPGVEQVENSDRRAWPLPIPGAALTFDRYEEYFLIGVGEGTVDAAITALGDAGHAGLESNTRFADSMQQLAFERTGSVLWVDVKSVISNIRQILGPGGIVVQSMANVVGLNGVDSLASVTGAIDGSVQTRSLIKTNGTTRGILALASGRAIKTNDLQRVPADADALVSFSLNAAKIVEAVRTMVASAGPEVSEQFEAMLLQLETELGLSLEKDLFEAFGDVWVIYDSPSGGGFFVTSPVVALEVRDPQLAYSAFTQLMTVLQHSLRGEYNTEYRRMGVYLAQQKFLDHTIYYVNSVGRDTAFAPAFCVTDDQLLMAPHPQALKAHLRFLADEGPTFASRIERGELPIPEGELLLLSYFDSKAFVKTLYAFAPYVGQMVCGNLQSHHIPIDIFSLPSARAVLPYINDSVCAIVRTPAGIRVASQTALPIPGGVMLPVIIIGRFAKMSELSRLDAVAPVWSLIAGSPRHDRSDVAVAPHRPKSTVPAHDSASAQPIVSKTGVPKHRTKNQEQDRQPSVTAP